ncbi:DUF6538 domain-containing protein [Streptomyces scabiei]|uniref:DUF6538 domain-containing protein n=1 Tax=Streptomyces scabiei TaxID=1930 RepID=UPI0038F79AB3
MATHLGRQHRSFFYKRAVPTDLQHMLHRKKWKQSLKRLVNARRSSRRCASLQSTTPLSTSRGSCPG